MNKFFIYPPPNDKRKEKRKKKNVRQVCAKKSWKKVLDSKRSLRNGTLFK